MPNRGDPRIRFSRHVVFNLSRPEKSLMPLAPLAKTAGGWATAPLPVNPKEAKRYPVVFANTQDTDYQALLAGISAGKKLLDTMTRFSRPNFIPRPAYLRELKRYGILSPDFDSAQQKVDVYDLDRRHWESLWYQPVPCDATQQNSQRQQG